MHGHYLQHTYTFCDIGKQYDYQAAAAGLNHVACIGNGEAGGATLPQCARIHSGCAAQSAAGRPGRALRRQQLPEVCHAAVLQAHHGQDAGQSEGACTPLLQCSACNICTTLCIYQGVLNLCIVVYECVTDNYIAAVLHI